MMRMNTRHGEVEFFISRHHYHGTTYSAGVTAAALAALNARPTAKKIEAAWVAPDYDCINIYFDSPQQFRAAMRRLKASEQDDVTCYGCKKTRTDATTSCECGSNDLVF